MEHKQVYSVNAVGQSDTNYITVTVSNLEYSDISTTAFDVVLCTTNGIEISTATTTKSDNKYTITWTDSWGSSDSRAIRISDDYGNSEILSPLLNPTYTASSISENVSLELLVGSITLNDYDYSFYDDGTMSAKVTSDSKTKTSLSGLYNNIYDMTTDRFYKLNDLSSCFMDCTSLLTPPVIPFGVKDMSYCFFGDHTLLFPPKLPATVVSLKNAFRACYALETSLDYYIIPENVTDLQGAFYGVSSDDWVSKLCILNTDTISDISYAFCDTTSNGDARGLLYNKPTDATHAFSSARLSYGSEILGDESYDNTTISTWPIKTTPSSDSKLNLSVLLHLILTQIYNISLVNESSFIQSILEKTLTISSGLKTYFPYYNVSQSLRSIRNVLVSAPTSYSGDSIVTIDYPAPAFYEQYGDGVCKFLYYADVDVEATQKCAVGSKYIYNVSSAESSDLYFNNYEQNATLWQSTYLQPMRRGNPICMSGTASTGEEGLVVNCIYFCTATTHWPCPTVVLGILVTDSIDNFYE